MPFERLTTKGLPVPSIQDDPVATQELAEFGEVTDAYILEQWATDLVLIDGLTYAYKGGVIFASSTYSKVADGTVALAASATNYIEHDGSGVVTVNQVGFSDDKIPMAKATTDATGITDLEDWRINETPSEASVGAHVIATTVALGPQHTTSGLSSGMVIRATGATTAAFSYLSPSDVRGGTANVLPKQSATGFVDSSITDDGTTVTIVGNVSVSGEIRMTAAVSQLIPGGTSFSIRNNVDGADNLIITDAGAATFRSTVGGITTLTATTLAGTLSTVTQNNVTTMTGLVTVSALNIGSITSGFGSINIGSSTFTTTGAVATGTITVTGDLLPEINNARDIGNGLVDWRNLDLTNEATIGGILKSKDRAYFGGVGGTAAGYKINILSPNAANGASFQILPASDTNGTSDAVLLLSEDSAANGRVRLLDSGVVTVDIRGGPFDTYFNGGNVGIGLTNPDRVLHVQSSAAFLTMQLEATTTLQPGLEFNNVTTGRLGQIYATNTADLVFVTGVGGVIEPMRMLANGNVGIGTASPSSLLDVAYSGSAGKMTVLLGANEGGSSTRTNNNEKAARIGLIHYTNAEEPVGMLSASADSGLSQLSIGGGTSLFNAVEELRFYTAADTTTPTGTRVITIDKSQNVGIGTTTPARKLHTYLNDTATAGMLLLEQDSTGDAAMEWLLTGGQAYYAGIDNSDSDKWILGRGSVVGTTPMLSFDTSGNATIEGDFEIDSTNHVFHVSAATNQVGLGIIPATGFTNADQTLELRQSNPQIALRTASSSTRGSIGWWTSAGVRNWTFGTYIAIATDDLTLSWGASASTIRWQWANITGALSGTIAGLPLHLTNTTDTDRVEVLRLEGDRATPAANDVVYISGWLSDGAGTQTEFGRINFRATDINAGNEDGAIIFDLRIADVLTTDRYKFGHTQFEIQMASNPEIVLRHVGGARLWSINIGNSGAEFNVGRSGVANDFQIDTDGGVGVSKSKTGAIFNIQPGVVQRDLLTSVGLGFHIETDTWDINAAGNGETVAIGPLVFLGIPTWTSTGTTYTVTDAATIFLEGVPVGSTNVTLTNAYHILTTNGANLNSAGTWNDASSRERKEGFLGLSPSTTRQLIRDVKVYRYTWRHDGHRDFGVVADEFNSLLYNADMIHKLDSTAVAAKHLGALALLGVQDHEDRIENLEAENQRLKDECTTLRAKITQLELAA